MKMPICRDKGAERIRTAVSPLRDDLRVSFRAELSERLVDGPRALRPSTVGEGGMALAGNTARKGRLVPRSESSALRSAVPTGLALAAAPDPSLALASADGSSPAFDELASVAESLVEPEPRGRHEVDQLPTGQPRFDVFGSHVEDRYTRARVLVFPPPLKQADLTAVENLVNPRRAQAGSLGDRANGGTFLGGLADRLVSSLGRRNRLRGGSGDFAKRAAAHARRCGMIATPQLSWAASSQRFMRRTPWKELRTIMSPQLRLARMVIVCLLAVILTSGVVVNSMYRILND